MLWLWTVLCGAAASVVAAWIAYRISNRHVLRLCSSLPCVQPCHPVLGNALVFAQTREKITESLLEIVKEATRKGQRAVCFWVGPYPLVFVTDPNDIKAILNNSLSRGKEVEETCREVFKYGLLTATVDLWKVTRRHLNLSFHPRNLDQLMSTFNHTSRQLVADLSGHVDSAVFNLMPHVMSSALMTICTFLYGSRTMERVSTEEFNDLMHAVELGAELMALRLTRPWINIGIVAKLLHGKEINSVIKAFRRILQIANTESVERELLTDRKGDDADDGNGTAKYAFQTVIDAMRELQDRVLTLTDQHVMDEMISFFTTGTDSIGTTVSSCLLALARFPHIQDKVYEEIQSFVSDDYEGDITKQDLKRLTYLDQVLKETLRFFTVVPFTFRALNKDMDLDGCTIPANKPIFICLSSVFFDAKYFIDPYQFEPDRFSKPNSADDVFVPFSRGPRNCIGKAYSMMLMKVMVTHVVRKYKLSTNVDVHNMRKKYMVLVTSCDGYNVFLTKRSG